MKMAPSTQQIQEEEYNSRDEGITVSDEKRGLHGVVWPRARIGVYIYPPCL